MVVKSGKTMVVLWLTDAQRVMLTYLVHMRASWADLRPRIFFEASEQRGAELDLGREARLVGLSLIKTPFDADGIKRSLASVIDKANSVARAETAVRPRARAGSQAKRAERRVVIHREFDGGASYTIYGEESGVLGVNLRDADGGDALVYVTADQLSRMLDDLKPATRKASSAAPRAGTGMKRSRGSK